MPVSGGGTRRSSAQAWTSSLAPRFERKAAAEAEQKHIYYEGEFCEAEDLPNGFTKIRSVNLVKLTKLFISDNDPCFPKAFILIEMLTYKFINCLYYLAYGKFD